MNRSKSNIVIGILIAMVVFMSIGFAATSYTQLLTISGSNVTVKSASWNIHFDRTSYAETTGSIVGTHTLDNTVFTYNVTLSPNEFYSAEFDVVNSGTLDAELESITMTPTLTTDQLKYLNYYFEYDNQTYTASQVFNSGLPLASNATKHVKVYVEYFTDANNANDLPEQDEVLTLSVALNYKQV